MNRALVVTAMTLLGAAAAVVGGARGTGHALRERQVVVRNWLRNRGHAVLN